jgi:WD40 repeat protein/DNA-binding SARP family transcriptional activator
VLEIHLLGWFEIRLDGESIELPSRPAQSLLAYLLLNLGAHRREKLAGLLWPETTDVNARKSLRQALWLLRKVLGADHAQVLITDDISISINKAGFWLDTAILDSSDSENSIESLIGSAQVYRGELLPGFYDDWLILERERLQMVFERKMRLLLDRWAGSGQWGEVVEWSERWLALGHAPEPAYRALMVAHANLNDQSSMAAAYQRCRETLARELGVEPSEETDSLYQNLAGGKKTQKLNLALSVPQAQNNLESQSPAPGKPPFMGLQYFNEENSSLFFGREDQVGTIVAELQENHLPFFVIGASGSGKSSLLRAGVIPALKRDKSRHGRIRVMTPGEHPLHALTVNLPPGHEKNSRLVLIVDQFEELFSQCNNEIERQDFVDRIMRLSTSPERNGSVMVVIALRADFYAHCAQYASLRDAMARHQLFIGPMRAEELRRAIEEPARLGGWTFEPGLVDLILREAGQEPGVLPLLSHALLETWNRRRGRVLTLNSYVESGGVRGAISRTADWVLHHLEPAQQAVARNIFLRLTQLGELDIGTDTRRRAPLAELMSSGEHVPVIEKVLHTLADARLITIAEDSAEVSHEALIREWPTLQSWLQEDRIGLQIHRHLTRAAQDWEQLERDEGELYRGTRLAQSRDWAETHGDALNDLEREFLNASIQWAEREANEQKERLERELETAQKLAETETRRAEEQKLSALRLKRRAFILAATLAAAILLAITAFWFGQQAWTNAKLASSRELAAASISSLDADPERSILLALYALDKADTPQARDALYQAVQRSHIVSTLRSGDDIFVQAVYRSNGKDLVTVNTKGIVQIWSAESGTELSSFALPAEAPISDIFNLAFSADGSRVAQATGSEVSVFDTKSGERIALFKIEKILGVALDHDGSRLAAGTMDGVVVMHEINETSDSIIVFEGDGNPVGNPFFSPDDSQIGAISVPSLDEIEKAEVIVWNAMTAERINKAPGYRAALGPGGRLVTVLANNELVVWNIETALQLHTLSGHTNAIYRIAFSPDGASIATASWDRTARIWDMETGRLRITLTGHLEGVLSVAFSPNGTNLLTASEDKTARVWDLAPRQGVIAINTPLSAARAAFSPDGKWLALGLRGGPGRVLFWDAASGEELLDFETQHTSGINTVAFSPDQTRFATASHDKTVSIWNLSANEDGIPYLQLLHTLKALEITEGVESIYGVAFTPDGTLLGTAADDGSVGVWDVASGEAIHRLTHPGGSPHIVFNADGSRFATAGYDGTVRIWNTISGEEIRGWKAHSQSVWGVAFSPDGKWIATASRDGTAKLWNAETGEETRTFSGHSGTVVSVAFSPNSLQLATSSRDGTAKLWDVSTGQMILTFANGNSIGLNSAVFSPDGSRLATAGNNGIRIYSLFLEDLISLARSRLTRDLTPEECFQYLHEEICHLTGLSPKLK